MRKLLGCGLLLWIAMPLGAQTSAERPLAEIDAFNRQFEAATQRMDMGRHHGVVGRRRNKNPGEPANDHVRALVPVITKLNLDYDRYINVHASAAPQHKSDVVQAMAMVKQNSKVHPFDTGSLLSVTCYNQFFETCRSGVFMSTVFPSKPGIERNWHVIDANDVVLGKTGEPCGAPPDGQEQDDLYALS